MLKKFRIEEDEGPQNSSMSEIQSKQGASRGLTIVNDDVFNIFIQLNGVVQHNCTFEHFHIHGQKTFQLALKAFKASTKAMRTKCSVISLKSSITKIRNISSSILSSSTTPPNKLIQVFISSMSESILFLQK
jgi:hypothetical protein